MRENSIHSTQPAGDFSHWLHSTLSGAPADVPCGDCNACCRSSYFIHIRAHESAALAAIPQVIRFPAPGGDPGDQIMGFSEQGACPMLGGGQCQIYSARPQTCRDYDCRIFAACGIDAGAGDKRDVNQQVSRWQFSYPTKQDQDDQQALLRAVEFLQSEYSRIGMQQPLDNPTQLALLAIRIYDLFADQSTQAEPSVIAQQVRTIMGEA